MAVELCRKCGLPIDDSWPAGLHTCPEEPAPAPEPADLVPSLGFHGLALELAAVRDDVASIAGQVAAQLQELRDQLQELRDQLAALDARQAADVAATDERLSRGDL